MTTVHAYTADQNVLTDRIRKASIPVALAQLLPISFRQLPVQLSLSVKYCQN